MESRKHVNKKIKKNTPKIIQSKKKTKKQKQPQTKAKALKSRVLRGRNRSLGKLDWGEFVELGARNTETLGNPCVRETLQMKDGEVLEVFVHYSCTLLMGSSVGCGEVLSLLV